MPFDGRGVFQRKDGAGHTGSDMWAAAERDRNTVNGVAHDTHDEDVVSGLELAWLRDGQNSPTADLPMDGRKFTGVADATEATEFASYGQLIALTTPFVLPASVGGTNDAITLSPSPAITSYSVGQGYRFFAPGSNTGPVTLSVSGLSAIALRRADGSAMAAGDISANRHLFAVYDGNVFRSNVFDIPEADTLTGPEIVSLLAALVGTARLPATAIRDLPAAVAAWSAITGKPSQFPPSPHDHNASDIVAGIVAAARLGTGTANNGTYLRGDGQWARPFDGLQDCAGFTGFNNAHGGAVLLTSDKPKIRLRGSKNTGANPGFRYGLVSGNPASVQVVNFPISGVEAGPFDITSGALTPGLYVLVAASSATITNLRITAVA